MAAAQPADIITSGQAVLGIEFGSTRIKATLIGPDFQPIAGGAHAWENRQDHGIWTYPLEEAWSGLAACYADLVTDVKARYDVAIRQLAAIGISGMMHGYLPLDTRNEPLVPFRTWRNNITGPASEKLSELFQFPIPQRWSVAHLYQAILNGEDHVGDIARLTTLAGYVHLKLTGEFVLGPDEASGMFPVDPAKLSWDAGMVARFNELIPAPGIGWTLTDLLPTVRPAGARAGELSAEGARLIDPSGVLQPGIPLCPPEGDAGTGMIATNAVRARTGNVSAGTSVFAMLVLEKPLKDYHPEIDMVLTPDGSPVAMAHSNNCSSDLDAWMGILQEAATLLGADTDLGTVFAKLLPLAVGPDAEADAGGLVTIPYVSGEHVTGFAEGRPLVARESNSRFTLANFLRAHLFSALAAMRTGLETLTEGEGVQLDEIRGHGGFFKTPGVGQRIMAAAINTRCSVMETAGEGGSWGMALLAAFMVANPEGAALPDFLDTVFADARVSSVDPDPADVAGYTSYLARYRAALAAERAVVDGLA